MLKVAGLERLRTTDALSFGIKIVIHIIIVQLPITYATHAYMHIQWKHIFCGVPRFVWFISHGPGLYGIDSTSNLSHEHGVCTRRYLGLSSLPCIFLPLPPTSSYEPPVIFLSALGSRPLELISFYNAKHSSHTNIPTHLPCFLSTAGHHRNPTSRISHLP